MSDARNWNLIIMLQALRKVSQDQLILLLCTTVFLSYLPEAGEYSSIFVYLRLVSLMSNLVSLASISHVSIRNGFYRFIYKFLE